MLNMGYYFKFHRVIAMITKDFALTFSEDWVDSWNSHDLERVLAHYSDDFEMNSPIIVKRIGKSDGKLVGKSQVRAYWAGAIEAYPNLRFQLKNVFVGVTSVTILYIGATGGLVTETFIFDSDFTVVKAYANYE